MYVELTPLTVSDAEAHLAGEDDDTIRWLSGGRSSIERTRTWIASLEENAARGVGKRGYGIWVDGRLGGYIEFDPDVTDGLAPGDVNVAYCIHPWARGRGVAGAAIRRLLVILEGVPGAKTAALRIEPENLASIRVAEKLPEFELVGTFTSSTDTDAEGSPVRLNLYRSALRR